MYSYVWHVIYFCILGPFTILFMACFERGWVLGKNMGFWPAGGMSLMGLFIFQIVAWGMFVFPMCFLIYRASNMPDECVNYAEYDKDEEEYISKEICPTWRKLHIGDFDIVTLLFVGLQILIRCLVISMKYGTISENLFKHTRTNTFDGPELLSHLTSFGWTMISPKSLMYEIAQTLKRMDIEPKFFTFSCFNNIGNEQFRKLTDSDFYETIDLDSKGNYSVSKAKAREVESDEVLGVMMDRVLDDTVDKNELLEETLKEKPDLGIDKFVDLWCHVEEEATQRDNKERYMFKELEGTLWIREAYL